MLTHASLFAGIGGFDLAARWAGWETRWVSEIDPYASRILAREFPNAPNLGDITKIKNPPPVDIITGGFPCQDISIAGKGAGIGGTRSGLWKEYKRIVEEVSEARQRLGQPQPLIVAENSPMLRTRGLDVVLRDLDSLGYDAEWHCIPASAVGAPHQRDRIWIVGYPAVQHKHGVLDGGSSKGSGATTSAGSIHPGDPSSDSGTVAYPHLDARLARREGDGGEGSRGRNTDRSSECKNTLADAGGNSPAWWLSEPNVGRVANGVPDRVDRLKCLGNAIVPLVAYTIFQAINDLLTPEES
jgi:DNA (cytosine-5)-methyltransferase 1